MTKSFKEYYTSNEEFKKRHLEKMKEMITCECGCVTARSHIYRHKKSQKHINTMALLNELENKKENKEIAVLKEEIRKLKENLKI